MSHLYGCDQRLNVYGVCSCDQIRQRDYQFALEAHTSALNENNRISAEILADKDQKIIELEKKNKELREDNEELKEKIFYLNDRIEEVKGCCLPS